MSVSYRDGLYKLLRESDENYEADGVYSVGSPGKFYIEAPGSTGTLGNIDYVVGDCYDLAKLSINIVVAGSLSANGYGDGAILTNGIRATIEDLSGNELFDFLDGETINSNSDWSKLGVDLVPPLDSGIYNSQLTGSALFFANHGKFFRLYPGTRFVLTFQDDLSSGGGINAMVKHSFMVSGRVVKDV